MLGQLGMRLRRMLLCCRDDGSLTGMRRLAIALRVVSVPAGIAVGLWTANLVVYPLCPPGARCISPALVRAVVGPQFAPWLCTLFGAAVVVVMFLVSAVVRRPAKLTR